MLIGGYFDYNNWYMKSQPAIVGDIPWWGPWTVWSRERELRSTMLSSQSVSSLGMECTLLSIFLMSWPPHHDGLCLERWVTITPFSLECFRFWSECFATATVKETKTELIPWKGLNLCNELKKWLHGKSIILVVKTFICCFVVSLKKIKMRIGDDWGDTTLGIYV